MGADVKAGDIDMLCFCHVFVMLWSCWWVDLKLVFHIFVADMMVNDGANTVKVTCDMKVSWRDKQAVGADVSGLMKVSEHNSLMKGKDQLIERLVRMLEKAEKKGAGMASGGSEALPEGSQAVPVASQAVPVVSQAVPVVSQPVEVPEIIDVDGDTGEEVLKVNQRVYPCPKCDKVFDNNISRLDHCEKSYTSLQDGAYYCVKCHKKCGKEGKRGDFLRHLEFHCKENPKRRRVEEKCDHCNRVYQSTKALVKHLKVCKVLNNQ